MTRSRSHVHRTLLGIATAAVLIAACGDETTESSTDTLDAAESTTTTTAPALVSDADAEPAETEPPPADTDPAPAATEPAPAETDAPPATESAPADTDPGTGSLPDCLVGDWVVNEDEMNAYYMALGQNSGADLEITADGNMLITMTPTDYLFTGDYTVNLSVAGQTGTGVATGTASGTWTVEDDILQSALTDSNLNIDVTVAGISFDGSDLGNSLLRSDPLANTPVSCDGPTLMFQSGPSESIRHPVVLTPA